MILVNKIKHDPARCEVNQSIDLQAVLLYNGWMNFLGYWKKQARALKLQALTLYYAYRDPSVPWYAKGFSALVVAYAFSPIDLIPDFIPVLGYLDDLVLIPLGVYLAMKMIPPQALENSKIKARQSLEQGKPVFRFMAVVIIAIWVIMLALVVFAAVRAARGT